MRNWHTDKIIGVWLAGYMGRSLLEKNKDVDKT